MEGMSAQVNRKILRPENNSLGIFILLAIAITFFSPLLFGDKVIFYRDFTFVTFPFKFFIAQIFQEGAIPYWNSNRSEEHTSELQSH